VPEQPPSTHAPPADAAIIPDQGTPDVRVAGTSPTPLPSSTRSSQTDTIHSRELRSKPNHSSAHFSTAHPRAQQRTRHRQVLLPHPARFPLTQRCRSHQH
jgi:hypothetical protein